MVQLLGLCANCEAKIRPYRGKTIRISKRDVGGAAARREEVVKNRKAGMGYREISEKCGWSFTTIAAILREAGLTR